MCFLVKYDGQVVKRADMVWKLPRSVIGATSQYESFCLSVAVTGPHDGFSSHNEFILLCMNYKTRDT